MRKPSWLQEGCQYRYGDSKRGDNVGPDFYERFGDEFRLTTS